MHKHAFQGLKRTFMQVSGLPPPYFDKEPNALLIGFLSKYDGGNLSHA